MVKKCQVKRQQLMEINQIAAIGLQDNNLTAGAFRRMETVKRKAAGEAVKAHMNYGRR